MKEYVFVEFIFKHDETEQGKSYINALGDDFIPTAKGLEWSDGDHRGYTSRYYQISGRIHSQTATALKLSNKFLSEHMRISYISDELKDKYRR